jgi:hypothetical protein
MSKISLIASIAGATCIAAVIMFMVKGKGGRIDASDDASAKASIEKIRSNLDPDRKRKFDEALQYLAFSSLDLKDIMSGRKDADSWKNDVMQSLDGMTVDEVIAEAEHLRTNREKKQREQVASEIQEIESRIAKAERDREELSKFEVVRSRYTQRENVLKMKEPIVELTVKNGTPHVVSRASFRGVLSTPGRTVPWLDEEFNYQIKGGLEPGEEATWTLAPNQFSAWGKVEWRDDMILTVDVVALDGPDGKTILSGKVEERDRERLEKLREKLRELE